MLKNLFCEDISVEYEFKSVKLKGLVDRLIMNKTPAKAFTPPAEKKIGTRWSSVEKVNE